MITPEGTSFNDVRVIGSPNLIARESHVAVTLSQIGKATRRNKGSAYRDAICPLIDSYLAEVRTLRGPGIGHGRVKLTRSARFLPAD
jgi:hypothetical protein